ncbi:MULTISPECIES: hypothetical protein [Burkholderia]|uniref:hypothetical protein n=1 Tax=Burkholderia TaxID=32008 RepID=UPI001E3C4F8A|nr:MULTISPECIES: hypothetical protein [Burkholderia]
MTNPISQNDYQAHPRNIPGPTISLKKIQRTPSYLINPNIGYSRALFSPTGLRAGLFTGPTLFSLDVSRCTANARKQCAPGEIRLSITANTVFAIFNSLTIRRIEQFVFLFLDERSPYHLW